MEFLFCLVPKKTAHARTGEMKRIVRFVKDGSCSEYPIDEKREKQVKECDPQKWQLTTHWDEKSEILTYTLVHQPENTFVTPEGVKFEKSLEEPSGLERHLVALVEQTAPSFARRVIRFAQHYAAVKTNDGSNMIAKVCKFYSAHADASTFGNIPSWPDILSENHFFPDSCYKEFLNILEMATVESEKENILDRIRKWFSTYPSLLMDSNYRVREAVAIPFYPQNTMRNMVAHAELRGEKSLCLDCSHTVAKSTTLAGVVLRIDSSIVHPEGPGLNYKNSIKAVHGNEVVLKYNELQQTWIFDPFFVLNR